jgi:hypothetical protein
VPVILIDVNIEGQGLPVFTLPLPDRVYYRPAFLERVVAKLFDYMLYADSLGGAGRVFLP